ncbi:MAG: DUF885 domain-containing protein [Oceanococcaceae bacterium]
MAMLNSMITRATLLLPALLLSACAALQNDSAPPADALLPGDWDRAVARSTDVEALGERYLQLTLAMNPVSGVSRGRHGTARDATLYDRSLPDIRPQALQQDMARLQSIEAALSAIDPAALSEADRADRRILLSKIRLDQLELGTLGAARNPLNYVGTLGSAYSGLLLREFAPLEQRLRSLGARCASTPTYLAQAQRNLGPADVRPTAVQKQLVGPRIAGMTAEAGMLRKTVPDLAATADMDTADRDRIVSQCAAAADALTAFGTWFADTVQPRPDAPWRLGADLYAQKYALYMDYPLDPAELLAEAEKALDDRYARLIETARTIHDAYLAEAIRTGRVRPAAQLGDDAVARNVLAEMSEDRPTVGSLIEDSYALADSIIGFVEREDLLDLPPATKLRIEPIPPHLSGYAVAMIQTAPPFEPHLDSVWFWDLPLLSQSEGFLKEYNRAALAEVYIHEGVPGHFVQLEYSNRADRLVPKVFWNGPMVEGWASYIQSQLVDAGYTVYPDHPQGHELQQIANLKLQLRAIINAIIDIRLHTTDWPAEQAIALMTGKGFQEEAEARGKLTRAKLSSVQLSSYFAGDQAIREILAEYRARKGDDFRWKTFNEKLLGAGSPPMDIVRERMLAADDAATADSRWRERTFY